MKYWEVIANKMSKGGFNVGWVSALDCEGRTIWIADAHRNGNRFVVRADEKLTAFLELEAAIRPTNWNSACYETALSNSTFAAMQLSRAERSQAEKLSSRHQGHPAAGRPLTRSGE
jgi:hypothetical protein